MFSWVHLRKLPLNLPSNFWAFWLSLCNSSRRQDTFVTPTLNPCLNLLWMTHCFIKRDQHCTYDKWDLVRINFGGTHCARSEDMACLRYGRGEGFCYEGEYRGSPSLMFLMRISFLAFQLLELSSRHLQLLVMNNEQLEPHGTKILLYRKGSRHHYHHHHKMELPYNPAIPFLVIYPKDSTLSHYSNGSHHVGHDPFGSYISDIYKSSKIAVMK